MLGFVDFGSDDLARQIETEICKLNLTQVTRMAEDIIASVDRNKIQTQVKICFDWENIEFILI